LKAALDVGVESKILMSMKLIQKLAVFVLALSAVNEPFTAQAQVAKLPYTNSFEAAELNSVPQEFLVLDGAFAVKEETGNKFLELPGAPLDSFGVLFGPTLADGVVVSARIFGTGQKRRFPTFSVGLNGNGGYKLQVSPAKKTIEIYKGDVVKASVPYDWTAGQWTRLALTLNPKSGATWKVEGKVWADGSPAPSTATILWEESEQPTPGRASITGNPYSNTPIRFDDLSIHPAK
jgi:hypothetical protein